MRLVVLGGGISGLAAAIGAKARERYVPGGLDITVLERESEVGGKARTLQEDGWTVEAGPTGFLGGEPAVDRLVEVAGLSDELVEADPASARRFLVRGGRLREVKAHPLSFARSGLLGPLGLARMLAEPLVPARRGGDDESVFDFARRRIGRQAAERLIAPMVLGVFAGDARRLSLASAFPRLHALEDEHGSLFRGMLARRRAGGGGGPAGPGGSLHSFRGGLQSLPRALASRAGATVRTGAEVTAVHPRPQGGYAIEVRGDAEAVPADALIVAAEPWAAASLLAGAAPRVAELLGEIACPPVAVVALGYGPDQAALPPRGFGALIPRDEGLRILGVLWDTCLFEGRAPAGHLLARAMIGGAVDPDAGSLSEDELIATATGEVGRLLGLSAPPIFARAIRWPRAIPQYEIGHRARVQEIDLELANRHPRLFVAGNALHGIAFGKAAAAGMFAGEQAARRLGGAGLSRS